MANKLFATVAVLLLGFIVFFGIMTLAEHLQQQESGVSVSGPTIYRDGKAVTLPIAWPADDRQAGDLLNEINR